MLAQSGDVACVRMEIAIHAAAIGRGQRLTNLPKRSNMRTVYGGFLVSRQSAQTAAGTDHGSSRHRVRQQDHHRAQRTRARSASEERPLIEPQIYLASREVGWAVPTTM